MSGKVESCSSSVFFARIDLLSVGVAKYEVLSLTTWLTPSPVAGDAMESFKFPFL